MQQIVSVWNNLSPRRRVIAVLASVAMFAAVLGLARIAASPRLTLLYAGLESGPAGEVVAALEQRGVAYEVRGGAIFVDATSRDALRMTLAAEGLPAMGTQGYELLDSLSGFGTTSQMFDAAYWRAKEGELARTITSSPAVTAARVHIAATGSNPFQRDVRPTASVSVVTANGALPAAQARALKYLVGSAVTGLAPEDVAVIDSRGGLIDAAEDPGGAPDAEDRAAALREKVQRLVDARVGYGNAVVEVSVETVTDRESIEERRFDPEGRVAVSTDTTENSSQATDSGGADVTVASNLPAGDAAGSEGTSSSQESETRERVNYEVSETRREILRTPGALKRLTVAVLVNGTTAPDPTGTPQFVPMAQPDMDALRELVASAVGFDEARGDVITIRSLPFELAPDAEAPPPPGLADRLDLDAMSLLQLAVLAVVALVLGLFVVRPILAGRPAALAASEGEAQDGSASSGLGATSPFGLPALTGEIDEGPLDFSNGPPPIALPDLDDEPDDPVDRLRKLIGERQDETVEILRSWLDDREETA